jgi:hypothetical protein
MNGDGFLDGLKSVGKVLKPVGVALKPVAKEVGKELLDLAAQAAKDKAREKMTKKPKEGKGLSGMVLAPETVDQLFKKYGDGIYSAGVSMSPAQSRSLRSGRGITMKSSMLGDGHRYEMMMDAGMVKKLMDAFRKNKGVKIVKELVKDIVDRKSGGSIFGAVARIVAPIITEKLIDVGVTAAKKKIDGSGIFAAGSGMSEVLPIQTGTPALLQSSPASEPFVPSQLLTVSQPPASSRKKKVKM